MVTGTWESSSHRVLGRTQGAGPDLLCFSDSKLGAEIRSKFERGEDSKQSPCHRVGLELVFNQQTRTNEGGGRETYIMVTSLVTK